MAEVEQRPWDPDESIVRLINGRFLSHHPLAVGPDAFAPSSQDEDGLSVFRLKQATAEQCLRAVPEAKRHLYWVATIQVKELFNLGLSLVESPIPEVPGHFVIPELGKSACREKKADTREIQRKLGKLAAQALVRVIPP